MAPRTGPDGSSDPLTQLAERAQTGDRGAFERLVRRFDPGLKRILLRRGGGDATLADELAQETWVAVWTALSKQRYDPRKAAISTFIYAVAHKRWVQHLRRRGSRPVLGGLDAALFDVPDDTENPASLLHAAEKLDALRDCLHESDRALSLGQEERRVVIGLSSGETERSLSAEMGLAASTIHARKLSAYKKLRLCLAAKGFALGAERDGDDDE
jgi:RNA polymerase sigma-70 factor (ECF subfamily)